MRLEFFSLFSHGIIAHSFTLELSVFKLAGLALVVLLLIVCGIKKRR